MPTILIAALIMVAVMSGAAEAADRNARLGRLNCEAGEIAKFDGQRWRCAEDETGSGSQYVLRDANGDQIGMVINLSYGSGAVGSILQGVQVVAPFYSPARGEDVNVVFLVAGPERIIGAAGNTDFTVFFESEDCTGTPWLPVGDNSFPVLTPGLLNQFTGELYAPLDEPAEPVTHSSRAADPCSIIPVEDRRERTLVPGEIVDPDLYATFPMPYTLEVE